MSKLLWLPGGVGLALAAATALVIYRSAFRRPAGSPRDVGAAEQATLPLVVAAGDSLTAATLSGDYVGELRRAFTGRFKIVNAGRNGETSAGLRSRVGELAACRPVAIILLIGTNDAIFSLVPEAAKHSRRVPDGQVGAYRTNLRELIDNLRVGTEARLALFSPPPLGEDLASDLNRQLQNYVDAVRDIAAETGVTYLPLNEALREFIRREVRAPRPFQISVPLSWGAAFKRYLFGRSWDQISKGSGFVALIDHIHLNDCAAKIAADLAEDYLRKEFREIGG